MKSKCLFTALFLLGSFLSLDLLPAEQGMQKDLKFLKKIQQIQPSLDKASNLLMSGDLDKARQKLEKCIGITADDPTVFFLLSELEYRLKNWDKAHEYLDAAEQKNRELREAIDRYRDYVKKEALARKADMKVTESELNSMIDALWLSGSCQVVAYSMEKKELQRDLTSMDESVKTIDGYDVGFPPEYSYLRGNIYFRQQKLAEAERAYLIAVQKNPNYTNACNNLINLYFVSGQIEKAQKQLDEASANGVEINPKLAEAVRRAGRIPL